MSTYKGIQGYTVQKLSSDPTASEAAGQLWYNSTSGKFKIATEGAGAWASINPINTGRNRGAGGGIGTQTAGMIAGGFTPGNTAAVEQFDGTTWTEGPMADLPTATADAGQCGTQTAGLVVCGTTPGGGTGVVDVFEGDGSTWTAGGAFPAAKESVAVGGIQTAALSIGGAPLYLAVSWKYDGTAWTATGDYIKGSAKAGIAGVQTAAIGFGGGGASPAAAAATFDGTSWTAITSMSTDRDEFGWSTKGTTTDVLASGSPPGTTEKWNGSSWTELGNMGTGRKSMFSGGTAGGMWFAGGTPYSVLSEEWNDPVYTIKTVTVS